MKLSTCAGFLLLAGLFCVACGGTTSSSPADGGSDSVAPGCVDQALQGRHACVIGRAKANAPLTLQMDADGCVVCGATLLPCSVEVSGTTITVGLSERRCPLPPGVECAADCALPRSKCELPPLPPGAYRVVVQGLPVSSEGPTRTLVVEDGATDTACQLDFGLRKALAASDFPQACTTAEDCALVVEGDQCDACACATGAVAKTALPNYEAAARERASQCYSAAAGSCAPCIQRQAACLMGKCAAVTK
jgi:hypothetical protein